MKIKTVAQKVESLKAGDHIVSGKVAKVSKPANGSVQVETESGAAFMAQGTMVNVAALDLTPAQQYADELVTVLVRLTQPPEVQAVLDKIQPPAMPTTAEVVEALEEVIAAPDNKAKAMAVLVRARRVTAAKAAPSGAVKTPAHAELKS